MPILPYGPFAPLLIGACLFALLPKTRRFDPVRRPFVIACFSLSFIGLCLLSWADGRASAYLIGRGRPDGTFALQYDVLSLHFSLLVVGSQLMLLVSNLFRPLDKLGVSNAMLCIGATVLSCASANLWTLLMAWGVLDLILMARTTPQATPLTVPRAIRQLAGNALSLLLLLISAVVASQNGSGTWASVMADPLALRLLIGAAWLRLAAFPLPGHAHERYLDAVIALATGGCLWLRVIETAVIPAEWVMPIVVFAAVSLFSSALLSNAAAAPQSMLHMLAYGVALMLLAPMLGEPGRGLALVASANIILGMTLWRVGQNIKGVSSKLIVLVPEWLGLCTLAGSPFTLGFATSATFLLLAFNSPWPSLGWLALLTCGMLLWSVLSLGRSAIKGIRDSSLQSRLRIGAGALLLTLIQMIFLLAPSWGWAAALGLGSLPWPGIRWIGALIFLVALQAIFAYLILEDKPVRERLTSTVTAAQWLLGLDWLYAIIDRLGLYVQRVILRLSHVMEETIPFAWVLLWSLGIALYLMQG